MKNKIEALELAIKILQKELNALKSIHTDGGTNEHGCKEGEVWDDVLKRCVLDVG